MTYDELKASFPLVTELLDESAVEAESGFDWSRVLTNVLPLFDLPRVSAAVEKARAYEFADYTGTAYDWIVEGGFIDNPDLYKSLCLDVDPDFAYLDDLLLKVFDGGVE